MTERHARMFLPLMWVSLCFALGIAAHKYIHISFILFSFLTVLFLFLSLLIHQPKIATIFLLLSSLSLGAVYARNYETLPPNHISSLYYSYRKNPVWVEGTIVSDVESRLFFKAKKTVFSLKVKRVKTTWGWKNKKGIILVNLFRDADMRYGDYMVLEGKLHRPFNFSKESNFSYRDYLSRQGITFILSVKKTGHVEILKRNQGHPIKSMSLRLRHKLSDILERHLPKAEGSLMQAFLLGERHDIPKNVYELFKLSGVAHIVAISGFNIGIVAYLIFLVLKIFPIPRGAQYVLTMGLLIFYAFLTGGQPPVVRATIMAVLFLASFLTEREQDSVNTLSVAALILLLMNPLNLFDVGFQLSFISVLFIIIFYPRWMGLFYKWLPRFEEESKGDRAPIHLKLGRFLLQSMAISLAAYMGVIVLVAYYFHLITPIVIAANLVVVPLVSLIIFLGMGLLAAGVMCPFAAFAFANCIIILLNLMMISVYFFAQIPGAYFPLKSFPEWMVLVYYGLILVWFYSRDLIKWVLRR